MKWTYEEGIQKKTLDDGGGALWRGLLRRYLPFWSCQTVCSPWSMDRKSTLTIFLAWSTLMYNSWRIFCMKSKFWLCIKILFDGFGLVLYNVISISLWQKVFGKSQTICTMIASLSLMTLMQTTSLTVMWGTNWLSTKQILIYTWFHSKTQMFTLCNCTTKEGWKLLN